MMPAATLPARALAVIVSTVVAATALIAAIAWRYGDDGFGGWGTLTLLTALVVAAWSWRCRPPRPVNSVMP